MSQFLEAMTWAALAFVAAVALPLAINQYKENKQRAKTDERRVSQGS